MKMYLEEPNAVKQARESQKGLHWALEILIFVAVFLVCAIGQVIVMIPIELICVFGNAEYRNAIFSGEMNSIQLTSAMFSSDTYTICSLFSDIIMILLVFLFCKLIQKRKIQTLGFTKKGAGKEYLKGMLAGFVMFSAAVLLCVVTGALKLQGVSDTFVLSTFLWFIAGYMIQGMAEEVLCRGYFMVSVGRRYPMIVAVILNSVAFAALHLLNPGIAPLAIVNLILFGIFASVCFIKTDNIWLVGALHSVWNLVQGNVYGIKVSGMETSCTVFSSAMTEGREFINGGAFGLEGGLAVTIVLVIGIAILCLYKKKSIE